MFYSQNIKIFVDLENPETQKSVTPTLTLLHVRRYTFDCFVRRQGSIKKKFDQILVPIMPNISNLFHYISFPTSYRPFHIWLKLQRNAIFKILLGDVQNKMQTQKGQTQQI